MDEIGKLILGMPSARKSYTDSLYDLPDNERRKKVSTLRETGILDPVKEGVLTELGQSVKDAAINVGAGFGSTLEETAGIQGVSDYFEGVRAGNMHVRPDASYSATNLDPASLARTIGTGVTQSALAIGAGVTATALTGGNPIAGTAAMGTVMFGQIYGDTVKDYRAAMPNQDEKTVKSLAFISAAGQSLVESVLGPEAMAAGVTKGMFTAALKETTKELSAKFGASAAKQLLYKTAVGAGEGALGEGTEEVMQLYWDKLVKSQGTGKSELPQWDEVKENFFGGAIPGAVMGGAIGAINKKANVTPQVDPALGAIPVKTVVDQTVPISAPVPVTALSPVESITLAAESKLTETSAKLTDEIAKELGVKVRYFDQEGVSPDIGSGYVQNGWFDKESNEIWIDRSGFARNPLENLGHEFKHFLEKNHGDLSESFDTLFQTGMNEEGRKVLADTEDIYTDNKARSPEAKAVNEFSADTFSKFWTEPDFWSEVVSRAEAKKPGMGQKVVDALNEFIRMVRVKLKEMGTPEAKELFDNMGQLRESAINALVEYKRRTGTSTEAENMTTLSPGGGQVVKEKPENIKLDPEFAQFKSGANKKTGVVPGNELGGKFDQSVARPLYVWESNEGERELMEGHHRFDLGVRSGIKEIDIRVDREADGVTREAARRHGVIMNILDGQGEIRDYAEFIRNEKMDEKTAEKAGITARKKGKQGYTIGHYASDNLYASYRNGDISDVKTATVAEIARGDEGLEALGIRAAKTKTTAQLMEYLRVLKLVPRDTHKQDDLFGFDDSALKIADMLDVLVVKHKKEISEQVTAARAAIRNPEAAKKLGVKVGKEAESLLDRALKEQAKWDKWEENHELYQQLLKEAGIEQAEVTGNKAEIENTKNEPEQQGNTGNKAEIPQKPEVKADTGRFDLNSETPLLSKEEDKNDFQLKPETAAEEKKNDVAKVKAEDESVKARQEEQKKESPELGISIDERNRIIKEWESRLGKHASKFKNTTADRDTLIQEGRLAIDRALQKYDATKGAQLDTYINSAISNAMLSAVGNAKRNDQRNVSINAENSEGSTFEDVIADELDTAPDEKTMEQDAQKNIQKWLSGLDKRSRRIVEMRQDGETLETISKDVGVSRERVRQILDSLKTELNERLKTGDSKFYSIAKKENIYQEQYDAVVKKFKGTDKWLKAPNGKDTKLTERQWVQVRTPAFKEWFGDWEKDPANASKVVDVNGEPRVVWHITDGKHTVFDLSKTRKNADVQAFFFSSGTRDWEALGGRTVPTFLNMRNPKIGKPMVDAAQNEAGVQLRQALQAQGHDGIIEAEEGMETEYAVFASNQIKSATDNIGAFDGNNPDIRHSISRRHNQRNPIREAGDEQDMYADKLDTKTYDVKPNETLNEQAAGKIAQRGGVSSVIEDIVGGDFKFSTDVAQRMAQVVLNSPEFKKLSSDEQVKIADEYIKAGYEAGRNLASRRLGLLDMNDINSIQAHINAMITKAGKYTPLGKLKEEIKDKLGIDVYDLPEDILSNPTKLDRLIREIQAKTATVGDKAYEFWINGILSGVTTHAANIIGNTTNMAYELGAKRLVESALNLALKNKEGATFSEFKDMWKAFDHKTAWTRAVQAFNLESLTAEGKIEGRMRAAIGGELGRVVRIPGRFLRAADEYSKALIIPIEATAYAHREGIKKGLKDNALKDFITEQLNNDKSKANEYASLRAKELTFQEDPGVAVDWLMRLKEQGGISGNILKFILPFVKTPANLLNQGVRKSPLGAVKLGYETIQAMRGKREFDAKYVQHVAEQILAWGAVAALMSLDDDDDLPFITGTSARYGSAEQKFESNKVPPYSIRIGDTYYSYKRIEPIATGLAFIADGMKAYRDANAGKDGTAIMKQLIRGAVQLVSEKSFLDSLGQVVKIAEDPEGNVIKFGTNFASSWMPNVVRQSIGIFDDNIADNKSRSRGSKFLEDQFQIITNRMGMTQASPKIDYFGREVTKDALADGGALSPLMRLIPITQVEAGNMDRAETLMWNYNQANPNDEYYPDVPAAAGKVDGKDIYFEGEDYHDYAIESGKLAHKQINNAIKRGLLNVNRPSEEDIKLIKKIFQRARKETKEKFISKRRYTAK